MNRSNQRGFTLVEIAIVLVIIGLLLGGILKGQELITSARVRNLADQASGLQAAYYGFIDRYRAVPGDMVGTNTPNGVCNAIGKQAPGCTSGATTIAGDGNGQIDDSSWGEASAVWAHLAAAGFIPGAYPGGATGDADYTATTVAPVNAFGGRLLLARTSNYDDLGTGTLSTRLNLAMGRSVPVNVMRELDAKIDNGQPKSGVLRAAVTSGGSFTPVNEGDSTSTCVSGTGAAAIWDINTNSADCNGIYLF